MADGINRITSVLFIIKGNMNSVMNAFKRSFPALTEKGLSRTFLIFGFSLFFLLNTLALAQEDTLYQPICEPLESDYRNYAQNGSYENEAWFSVIPQWHYYDMFGNKIIDGDYLYGISMNRNTQGTGTSNIALHPFLKKLLNGLVQVADLHENCGIMAMVGDRVKSEFTPFTLKQTLFAGSRFDVFYKENSLSFLTNRISNTGTYGMYLDESRIFSTADWITGAHGVRKLGELADIGGTYVNFHHEETKNFGNPFSGVDSDTSTRGTSTGLSLYGLDANLKLDKIKAYCEFARSQEFLDGDFRPKAGDVAALNGHYDLSDKWQWGGEFYTLGSRYKTNFFCPAHPLGDQFGGLEKYQYSLIEDNDDQDEYPENGRNRYSYIPQGDPDGVIPINFDKDKNGVYDYEEDFLSYEEDPPESKILFDRNNNGVPDEIEDDAYPDYPYVPGYYLPDEKYRRYNEVDGKWETRSADSLTHKGQVGVHLNSRYDILQNLEVTVGGIFDRTQEKTFQMTYDTSGAVKGEEYAFENATNLYFLAHFKKDIARDKFFTIDDYFRRVQDNIPNHTQGFVIHHDNDSVSYYTNVDKLEYRDMFADALRAEFTLFRNRGFNFTSAGKYEFQKHFPRLEFNYPDENISSFMLVNKCEYIYLLPFYKDLFLIPKYKNIYEYKGYGPNTSDSLDVRYRRNSMTNAANLMCEWKVTARSALSTGLHLIKFNDFKDTKENFYEPSFSIQLMLKDRYKGYAIALTTAFTQYAYIYEHPGRPHNPLNNVHRAVDNLTNHQIFIKVYCGVM
jgi:hypothetical protein